LCLRCLYDITMSTRGPLGVQEVVGSNPAVPTDCKDWAENGLGVLSDGRKCGTKPFLRCVAYTLQGYLAVDRPPRIPSYRLHKPTDQAIDVISKKTYYLGRFGTTESRAEYNRIIAEWLSGNAITKPAAMRKLARRLISPSRSCQHPPVGISRAGRLSTRLGPRQSVRLRDSTSRPCSRSGTVDQIDQNGNISEELGITFGHRGQ
jgi:hypothetical protein